jgi:hypothetical protein
MHPPVGFALFYLRSVAPRVPYTDKVTGIEMQPVTTAQIYWGAVPFVCIQVVMIAIVIMFPQMVMHYKGPVIDMTGFEIQVPEGGFGGGLGGGLNLGGPPQFNP